MIEVHWNAPASRNHHYPCCDKHENMRRRQKNKAGAVTAVGHSRITPNRAGTFLSNGTAALPKRATAAVQCRKCLLGRASTRLTQSNATRSSDLRYGRSTERQQFSPMHPFVWYYLVLDMFVRRTLLQSIKSHNERYNQAGVL